MDWASVKTTPQEWMKKYRFLLLILLLGILFMTVPDQKQIPIQKNTTPKDTVSDLQTELEDILSHISGAGSVKVLLTQASGEEIIYQTDEDISSDDIQRDTVLITNSNREDLGLIKQTNPPRYRGAVILCQGAERADIRLQIVKAVMSVTGLTSDHITVLKMK